MFMANKVSLRNIFLLVILFVLTLLHIWWNSDIKLWQLNKIQPKSNIDIIENFVDLSPVHSRHSFDCISSQSSIEIALKNNLVEAQVMNQIHLKFNEYKARPICNSNNFILLDTLYSGPYKANSAEYVYIIDQLSSSKRLENIMQCRYYVKDLIDFCKFSSATAGKEEASIIRLFDIPWLPNSTEKMPIRHIRIDGVHDGSCPTYAEFINQMCISQNQTQFSSEIANKLHHRANVLNSNSVIIRNNTKKWKNSLSSTSVTVDMSDMLIVVTTCNHIDITMKCIKSLEGAFSRYEVSRRPNIVIVDDRSIDGSAVLLKQMGYAVIESKIPKGVTYSWYVF